MSDRRTFLRGLAALPLIGSSVASGMASELHPDAQLIRLGAEFEKAWEREKVAVLADDDEAVNQACDRTGLIVGQIECRAASTFEGLWVKARAVSWCHNEEPLGPDSLTEEPTTDIRLAGTILRDILAMGCPLA